MYKLIKIKPTGMMVTLADGSDINTLISSGKTLRQDRPDLQLGIIDCEGTIVWQVA